MLVFYQQIALGNPLEPIGVRLFVEFIGRTVSIALRSLIEQRQRALLSALGIFVGSTAIILLISIATGVKADVSREVNDFGVNLLFVLPGHFEENSMFNPGLLGISYLEEQDVARVKAVPGVRQVVPLCFVGGGLQHEGATAPTSIVVASEPEWWQIRNSAFLEGRPLERSDDAKAVCVLGELTKVKLFGDGPAVGKQVVYNGNPYEVVGVTKKRTDSSALLSQGSFENFAYVPFQYVRRNQPEAQINRILIQTVPDRDPKSLVKAVEAALGERLRKENFTVFTQEELLKFVFSLMSILTWLLTGLTSIALFVGGVGIMTVMLMSVNERTREIGIRKAFGARRRDIFFQFLTEALLLAVVGGLAGLALSAVACWGLAEWTPIKPQITSGIVALAMGMSALVGGVFGLVPAMRAANREPVASLRHE